MTGDLHIQVVSDAGTLRRFVDLPAKLYRDDPCWVPGLRSAQFKLFSRRTAFFRHAGMELFLARRGRRDVARLAAIHNQAHNAHHKDCIGFFGFFECAAGDAPAAQGLFEQAQAWLFALAGSTALRGPVNPSMNGECGLLVDGFNRPPVALMPYNPPAYPALLEALGFAKCKDLYAYLLNVQDYAPAAPAGQRLERLAAALKRRHPEVTVRSIDMNRYLEEVLRLMAVFETVRRRNWGYVPLTEDEIAQNAHELRRIIDPRVVLIAEVAGRPAGALLAIPNINGPLKAVGGRLFPLGFLRFFRALKQVRDVRVLGIAALREDRAKGITALLFVHLLQGLLARGYQTVEASWVLEDNQMSNQSIEGLNPQRYKTYRLYERPIGP